MKNSSLDYGLFFQALSNKTRLDILDLLRNKSCTVNELSEKLNLEQSRVSHALKCLVNCAFVSGKPNGKERIYSINENVEGLFRIVDSHVKNYCEELESCRVLKR